MATNLRSRSPVFSITTDTLDAKEDAARIRAGRKTQKAILHRQSWHPMFSLLNVEPSSRSNTGSTLVSDGMEATDGQTTPPIRKSKTVRAMHKFSVKPVDNSCNPAKVHGESKWQRRRTIRCEKKRLVELEKFEREQFAQRIAQARQERERHSRSTQYYNESQQGLRHALKEGLTRTKRVARAIKSRTAKNDSGTSQLPSVPHVYDFENKEELRAYTAPQPTELVEHDSVHQLVNVPGMAELEATVPDHIPPLHTFANTALKADCKDFGDLPSPSSMCSPPTSSVPVPRRRTLGEAHHSGLAKQMQCDYCHDPIKMLDYHYQCSECDDGERIYCSRCVDESRTCRHNLTEKKRIIQRHPTNSQHSEPRSMPLRLSNSNQTQFHLPISRPSANGTCRLPNSLQKDEPCEAKLPVQQHKHGEHGLAFNSEALEDFDAKRREQEIAFREKEITLRERESILREQQSLLREREVIAQSREREAALIQAAALLHQRERAAEIGSQFTPMLPISRKSTQHRPEELFRSPSILSSGSAIVLEPLLESRFCDTKLSQIIANTEASISGISIDDSHVREHGNTKRKSSGSTTGGLNDTSTPSGSANPVQRSRSANDGDDNTEEDDSGAGSPKRIKQELANPLPTNLFACPYCKFDANRYSERNREEMNYRSCTKGVFRDMSRVKQHLKRVHHRPDHYCLRCFKVFKNMQSLEEHYGQDQICAPCPCPFPEKLDESKQNKVHTKRPNMDPRGLWYLIYGILFPGAEPPESPYVENEVPTVRVTNHQTAEMYVAILEQRLDSYRHSAEQSWLNQPEVRHFLSSQFAATIDDLLRRMAPSMNSSPAAIPSVLVSPISPPDHQQFLTAPQSPHSSGSSSPNQKRKMSTNMSPLLTPEQAKVPRRPILKVSTSSLPKSGSSTNTTPVTSAGSGLRFEIDVPAHVKEDIGYDDNSSSWRSGDDQEKMVERLTASRTRPVTTTRDRRVSFEQSRPAGQRNRNLKVNQSPIDSGYGTQSSRNSMRSPSRQPSTHDPDYHSYQSGQVTCIDPRLTVMGPPTNVSGLQFEHEPVDTMMGGNVVDDPDMNPWTRDYASL